MKRSYEDRLEQFQISLLNQPIDFEVEELTPLSIARRRWHGEARVIESALCNRRKGRSQP